MTEKRFIERYAGKRLIGIEDIETGKVCVTISENIKLLNELEEQKQSLEEENQVLKDTVEALQSELAHCEEDYIIKEYL